MDIALAISELGSIGYRFLFLMASTFAAFARVEIPLSTWFAMLTKSHGCVLLCSLNQSFASVIFSMILISLLATTGQSSTLSP